MNLPELRDDLRITPLSGAEQGLFVIEDPLRNVFFKIGNREYRFLCQLEKGKSSAIVEDDAVDENIDLGRDEALTLLKWLAAKQLLKNQSPEILRQIDQAEQQNRRKAALMSRFNPIILRLPLFNPDPLLTRLMPWIGWLAGPLFFCLWVGCALTALSILLTGWNQFVSQSAAFFSPKNLVIIAVIWILLKIVHELGHSVACMRHGGRVYEVGILFILFIPLTYVNATSSWSFHSRWQRIHVGSAGMYMELFAAWSALIYWFFNMGSPSGQIAHHTVLIAGISSLLFNANPLMRFDGYYILSDLVKVPNLYFRGLTAVRQILDRVFFGIAPPPDRERVSPLITLYGWGVYLWRILVIVTLSILACSLFGGWGLLLAAVAMGSWLYQILSTTVAKLSGYRKQHPTVLARFGLRMSALVLVCSFLLFGLSYRARLAAPAVVLFDRQERVRAETSGFIEQILVKDGDRIAAGDVIAVLKNDDLELESKDYDLQIAAAQLRKRQVDVRGDHAAAQALEEQLQVLRATRSALQTDLEALRISAPITGMVVGDISSRVGTFITRGEELLQIIGPESKHLVASVSQNDISALQSGRRNNVSIDMSLSGLGIFDSRVVEISPTASVTLAHFSLAAPFGGPLDVKSSHPGSGDDTYISFLPRFSVSVEIPAALQQQTRSGQQALIRYRGVELSPAVHLWQMIRAWFEGKKNQV